MEISTSSETVTPLLEVGIQSKCAMPYNRHIIYNIIGLNWATLYRGLVQGLTENIKLLTLALGNYFILAKSLKVKKKLLLSSFY